MTVPWRGRQREQFPGVPAWGVPSSRLRLGDFPLIGQDSVTSDWAWGGADGTGVRVCVVDSGVDGDHPLVGPIDTAVSVCADDAGELLIRPDERSVDAAGHGTAVASIIRSIAPGVSISSVRVLTDGIGGTGAALLAGLAWAVDEGFDVINMSLATTRQNFSLALYELADRGYFRRCTQVVSAHNLPVRSYPWSYASVISVASHDEPDRMLHYYNPSPPVEFYARGVAVPVAWPNGRELRTTGNSFAAPHIAGLCALILSKHRWLTPFQLKSVLYLTARNVGQTRGDQDATA
jgi:subtilisin family serine protease